MKKIFLALLSILIMGTFAPAFPSPQSLSELTPASTIGENDLFLISHLSGGVWTSESLSFSTLLANLSLITLSNNTTGNAATATQLAAMPSKCSAGYAALGVDAYGNAQGCWQPSVANANLTSLGNLTYISPSFVRMTGANTFSLDTTTYQPLYPFTITGTTSNTYNLDSLSVNLASPGPIGSNTPSTGAFTTDTAQSFQTSAADGTHIIQAYNSSSLPTCNTSTTPPTGTFGAIATVGNPPVAYLCNGSSWTTLGTGTGQTIPAAPSASASSGNGSITCSSTSSSGATSYNGFMGTSSPPSTEYDNVGTTWIISGLTNTVAEYCAFKACNTAGCSSLSNIATATPTAVLSAPGVPTSVAAVAGNMQNTVSWGAPTSGGTPSSYNLYWSNTDMGSTCSSGTKVTGVTSPDVITSLTNGTTYYYMLTCQNAAGESGCSSEVSGTPAVTPPNQPLNVAAVAGNTLATLSWNPPSGGGSVTQYNGGCSNASNTETFTSFANITSPANITGLTNGVLYYCKVQSQNAGGTAASAEVTVTPALTYTNYLNNANIVSAWNFENNTTDTKGNSTYYLGAVNSYSTTVDVQWGTYSAKFASGGYGLIYVTSSSYPGKSSYTSMSALGWINIPTLGIDAPIVSGYTTANYVYGWYLSVTSGNKANFTIYDSGGTAHSVTGGTTLSANHNYMIAGTWDGSYLNVYIGDASTSMVSDATAVAFSGTPSTGPIYAVVSESYFTQANTNTFYLDEVAVFKINLELSDFENIRAHKIDGSN